MIIFLDEAGDMGFSQNIKKGSSKYFIITLLVCEDDFVARKIRYTVTRTINTKINFRKKKKPISELKGAKTSGAAKEYLYRHLNVIHKWSVHALVVNKMLFKMPNYIKHGDDLYNFLVGYLLNIIPFNNSDLMLIADKCKSARRISEFNKHIAGIIYPKLDAKNKLIIRHDESYNDRALQAVDLFCHSIYRKYEHNDDKWYNFLSPYIFIEKTLPA